MVKKIISIFVCMLLCVTVFSVTGTEISDPKASPYPNTKGNRDMWDVQFQYPAGVDTGSLYLVGVVFDGTYFYCPTFNSNTVYRFDATGAYLDSFTITGVPNLIDLAWDGTYAYGTSTTGTILYQMDMAAHSVISQVNLPAATYNVAYDAEADGGNGGFWIGQWQTHMTLVDRQGNTLDSITPVPDSVLGFAWDPWTVIEGYNGPFLWIFSGTSTGMDGIIKVIDLDTKTLIAGVEHNVAAELGAGMGGGLDLTTDWESGTATLYGMVQGTTNDYMFGYEIATTNSPPDTPAAPTGPDTGVKGEDIEFSAVTTDPEGEQISYMFDWGDGTFSEWIGPVNSGIPAETTHAYTGVGTFSVYVKAKDINDGESGWSEAHTISISEGTSKLDISAVTGGLFKVKATIKNIGVLPAANIAWNITLVGGAFIGKESSGTITSLAAGAEQEITSKLIIGLGKTVVTVTATNPDSTATVDKDGKILLIFIKI